ncbi:MAG TPA: allantoate amidohydrolase [Steroidobacteraceae bacterium]|jgi:allantoate deiminase|nr:allantoate amidohydrolase [Steroidobacteraceae bacterium]
MSAPQAAARIMQRLDALAALTSDPPRLTRVFLSAEHRRANELVAGWLAEAGMRARVDAMGNITGRVEGKARGLPALMLGSHLDTVRDAGRYDGMLGVVTAIECAHHIGAGLLPFALEVVGFGDEEGVRFGSTLLGSRAIAGTLDLKVLEATDRDGISLAEALRSFGLDPAQVATAARRREDLLGYVELHIEQGPVLERAGLPVGCVTSINGATRLQVRMQGMAGHAGTVPMMARQDALVAAAEVILAVEQRCSQEQHLVGTVGRIDASPGAVNVIPGECRFTIDVRAPEDLRRRKAVEDLRAKVAEISVRRGIQPSITVMHDSPASPCAPWLMQQIDAAIAAQGVTAQRLPSGAGHDAMAISAIADTGMIFVRCAGGISHNPAESITVEDAQTGFETLCRFVRNLDPARRPLSPGP